MKRILLSTLLLLLLATASRAQCASCDGPTGERWSTTLSACIGASGASCGDGCTCWYGFLNRGGWLGGTFDKDSGLFIINNPGPLPGVQKGDQLRALGSVNAKRLTNLRTPRLLTRYTKARPARSLRLRIYRPSTGQYLSVRWPEK